ncbi:MAG: glycosyltransferase [Aeromonadaceae bacterium]|nr:glycosyltransferase [Aeromonadaceae bacterium]
MFIVKDLYGGGAEKVLINTADLLQKKGQDVRVYTLRDRIEHELPSGVHPRNIACVNKFTQAISNVFVEKAQAKIIESEICRFAPDVIISCACDKITRHLPSSLNIYYWIHGGPLSFTKDAGKSCRKFKRFYENKNIICVSHGMADDVMKTETSLKSCQVIYNPFDIKCIQERSTEQVNLPFSEYFLHVGSFEKRKRHDRLLDAYKLSGIETPLVLMGKGGLENEIREKIATLDLGHRVMVMEFQKNPFPYIKNAKALILTSDAEGLPTVLIEALVCHTPIISTNCPSGPSEILVDELINYLVDCDDIPDLARAIRDVDQRPPEIAPSYYEKFSSENTISKFMEL